MNTEKKYYKNILSTKNLSIGYKQSRGEDLRLLSDINLSIKRGELVCLLGPNGSGKSTLMRTIAGLQAPLAGHTLVEDVPIRERNFKEIAQLLSIVLTERLSVGNLTVYHIVSLGRHPHTSWMGRLSEKDDQIIKWAMGQVGLTGFANKFIDQLSDGERQRVMIAKALAQDTPLIMLDEPTAHLDLPNRVEIMRLLRQLAKETDKAILLSTHELDLALQAADVIWLMSKSNSIKVGTPEDLVLSGSIESTFRSKTFDFDKESGNFIMHYQKKATIQLTGNGAMKFWTGRALSREGYQVTNNETPNCKIRLDEQNNLWEVSIDENKKTCHKIEELILMLRKSEINY